jgi:hypothetical protein
VQLDDVLGLPLNTKLIPDPEVNTALDQPAREESLRIALRKTPQSSEPFRSYPAPGTHRSIVVFQGTGRVEGLAQLFTLLF